MGFKGSRIRRRYLGGIRLRRRDLGVADPGGGSSAVPTGRKETRRLQAWMEGARLSQAVTKKSAAPSWDRGSSAALIKLGRRVIGDSWLGGKGVGESAKSTETEGVRQLQDGMKEVRHLHAWTEGALGGSKQ